MIAHIVRCWPEDKVCVIIVREIEPAAPKETACFVFLPEGQFTAALCQRHEWNGTTQPAPLVLELEPKTRYGYRINKAEELLSTVQP